MNAEIIAVGSELLLGQIVNSNAQYISQQLQGLGINVYFHTVVGDNEDRLNEALTIATKRSQLIILTGGLGPTKDDLTKETVARFLGRTLVHDKPSLQKIESYFAKSGRKMTANNMRQAEVIENADILENRNGLAPGMTVTQNDRIYMLLPGPPKELKPMFNSVGKDVLRPSMKEFGQIRSRVLRFFGIGEAELETWVEDLIIQQQNPTIAPLAQDGEVTLRLTVKHHSYQEGNEKLDELEKRIVSRVGDYLYGYGETTLFEQLTNVLKEHSITLACAESLTGGLFSEQITSISGASTIFKGSVICYSNDVKKRLLHIPEETLKEAGAISEDCAKQLAEQVRLNCGSDIGISFTGVAGPATEEGHEVGTVFIGLAIKGKTPTAFALNLNGNRQQIRERTSKYGCYYLLKDLEKVDKKE